MMTTFAQSFGSRLRELRRDRRLTQTRLAVLTGIPQSTISNWENAVCEPGLREVIGLSAVLGVPLESFADLAKSETWDAAAAAAERG